MSLCHRPVAPRDQALLTLNPASRVPLHSSLTVGPGEVMHTAAYSELPVPVSHQLPKWQIRASVLTQISLGAS